MDRRISLVVVLLTVAALVAIGSVGAQVAGQDGGNETNDSLDIQPGERVAGVIGVQAAEFDGEMESRSFEARLEAAETDAERADVIANRIERNERRLAELAARQSQFRRDRESGRLSDGAFAAQTASIGASVQAVKRTTNRSAEVASGLPDELLAERGVDTERIRTLKERANELTGSEVAAVAREIGGNQTGAPMGEAGDRPGAGIGPSGSTDDRTAGNGTGSDAAGGSSGDTAGGSDDGADTAGNDGADTAGDDGATTGNETATDGDDGGSANGNNSTGGADGS